MRPPGVVGMLVLIFGVVFFLFCVLFSVQSMQILAVPRRARWQSKQSKTKHGVKARQSKTKKGKPMQNKRRRAKQIRQGKAKQDQAKQSNTKQRKIKQSKKR